MRINSILKQAIVLGVLFVALGDRVLPEPLASTSIQTRTNIEQFMMGLFPNWHFVNPDTRTEHAIQQLEEGQ